MPVFIILFRANVSEAFGLQQITELVLKQHTFYLQLFILKKFNNCQDCQVASCSLHLYFFQCDDATAIFCLISRSIHSYKAPHCEISNIRNNILKHEINVTSCNVSNDGE